MRGRAAAATPPPHATQAVYGLDVARAHALRARTVRRVWNQAVTIAVSIALAILVVAASWVGYQVYLEHTRDADIEHQRGVEDFERRNQEESLVDVIDDLEATPVFNGPGAPALGLAPGTTQP